MINKKPKILIIDDEQAVRMSIEDVLSGQGYELFFAENGKEGLSVLKKVSPILIILDIRMPVMNGYEFLEKIKIKPTDPFLITVLTGHGDDNDITNCYDLGVNSFLRKPFNIIELRCMVKRSVTLKQREEQIIIETKNRLIAERELKDKEMEEKLRHADKMASLGTMAAGVAHDINNPLTGAMGGIELIKVYVDDLLDLFNRFLAISLSPSALNEIEKLKKDLDTPLMTENLNKVLSRCEEAMGRIKDIVLGLSDFSRLDNGDEMINIDINNEIETSIQMIPNKYKLNIEIKKEFSLLPKIPCFGRQIGQVFLNIIVNALQAMKGGGILKIKTSSDDEHVYIKFCDNGSGIPENRLEKIFDPFYTTKPIGEGTGLGLSICHSIIKKHKGEIACESEVGTGTTFLITLPTVKTEYDSNQ